MGKAEIFPEAASPPNSKWAARRILFLLALFLPH